MEISMNNNIIITNGAVYDCIYDLNNGLLYRTNKKTVEFIRELCSRVAGTESIYGEKHNEFIRSLVDKKILCTNEQDKAPKFTYKCSTQVNLAWLEITQLCNFRCIHCYEGEKIKESMSLSNVKHIIDNLVKNKVSQLQLIGGEPMMHSEIAEILSYCVNKFEKVSIFTNASLINDEECELLKKLNATVYVSLHSDISKEFDRITQSQNMLAKVKMNIEKMIEFGLNPIIKKVKLSGIYISPEYESFLGGLDGFPVLVGNANLSQYDDAMLNKKIITEESFKGKLNPQNILTNMNEHHCFRNRVYIDVYGDVYPCILERRKKHGNILNSSLENVLNEEIQKTTKDLVEKCKMCEYRYACNTCYPDTLSNNFYAKPWFCSYVPERGEWIQLDEFIKGLRERENVYKIT